MTADVLCNYVAPDMLLPENLYPLLDSEGWEVSWQKIQGWMQVCASVL